QRYWRELQTLWSTGRVVGIVPAGGTKKYDCKSSLGLVDRRGSPSGDPCDLAGCYPDEERPPEARNGSQAADGEADQEKRSGSQKRTRNPLEEVAERRRYLHHHG